MEYSLPAHCLTQMLYTLQYVWSTSQIHRSTYIETNNFLAKLPGLRYVDLFPRWLV